MSYLVVDCPGCSSPRIVEDTQDTGECPRCGSSIQIGQARVHAEADELEAAQDALGQVNAHRAGGELKRADDRGPSSDGGSTPSPRDEIDRALQQARTVSSERMQIRLVAEGLTEEMETFTEEDWLAAMGRLDVPEARAREHLRRLARGSIVAEPEHGSYRYID